MTHFTLSIVSMLIASLSDCYCTPTSTVSQVKNHNFLASLIRTCRNVRVNNNNIIYYFSLKFMPNFSCLEDGMRYIILMIFLLFVPGLCIIYLGPNGTFGKLLLLLIYFCFFIFGPRCSVKSEHVHNATTTDVFFAN